jgi:hypothetical protein
VAALLLAALPALAEPAGTGTQDEATRNAARELARDAVTAYDAGDWAKAQDLIDRAYKLVPAPSISIWQARILAKMGKLIEANERYELTRRTDLPADAPDAFRAAVTEASDEVEALRPRIPKIRVRVAGRGADSPSLVVTLDGKPVPAELIGVLRTINPGHHALEARVPGLATAQLEVDVAERERKDVVLVLEPASADATPTIAVGERAPESGWPARKTWGIVATGIGVAGVATGIGFALAARSDKSKLDDACDGDRCPPSARDDLDSFRSKATIAWIGYGVGAAGLATGAVLLFAMHDSPPKTGVVPFLGPGSAGVVGRF